MMHMKFKQVLAGLLATMMLSSSVYGAPLSDVPSNSLYSTAVEYVNRAGIMVGDDQGRFNPDKNVTRAEMAAIICRMKNETSTLSAKSIFSDVPTSHWANPYVSKAVQLGIINGYGNGKFGPSDGVTYEQAITMIVRAKGLESIASRTGGYPNGYIQEASNRGYLKGIDSKQGDFLKRYEVAIIIYNAQSTGGMSNTTVPKIGIYYFADYPDSLTVYSVNGEQVIFSVEWMRRAGMNRVKGTLEGNTASFNYYNEGLFIASGYVVFNSNQAIVTITDVGNADIDKTTTIFDYTGVVDKKMLLTTESTEWINYGSYGESKEIAMQFFNDGKTKWLVDDAKGLRNYSGTYELLDGSRIRINNDEYLLIFDDINTFNQGMGAVLYLVSLGQDTNSLDGAYYLVDQD